MVHLTNVQRIATLACDDPDAVYRPVQDGLRAAGRYLDTHACRLSSLSLTDYSIVLTLAPADVHDAGAALVLTHADLQVYAAQDRAARGVGAAAFSSSDPLFPTGYEDFLRALGELAERCGWTCLRLVHLEDILLLHCGTSLSREERRLDAGTILQILNAAFRQRRVVRRLKLLAPTEGV
ncbi:MAG TPA: hypothetical protein VJY65_13440 [Chloroflexota bacterium]|nr:hypothetical protein [Chloroflexota bacterium]